MATANITVSPLSGRLGCEIAGADLASLSEEALDALYQAFLDHVDNLLPPSLALLYWYDLI